MHGWLSARGPAAVVASCITARKSIQLLLEVAGNFNSVEPTKRQQLYQDTQIGIIAVTEPVAGAEHPAAPPHTIAPSAVAHPRYRVCAMLHLRLPELYQYAILVPTVFQAY